MTIVARQIDMPGRRPLSAAERLKRTNYAAELFRQLYPRWRIHFPNRTPLWISVSGTTKKPLIDGRRFQAAGVVFNTASIAVHVWRYERWQASWRPMRMLNTAVCEDGVT